MPWVGALAFLEILLHSVCALTGMCSFARQIAGRNLVIWSDNAGAERATRKGGLLLRPPLVRAAFACAGTTKRFDHNTLVHSIWANAVALGCAMWVERVPTEVNLADDPSRWEHHHLCASLRPVHDAQGRLPVAKRIEAKTSRKSRGSTRRRVHVACGLDTALLSGQFRWEARTADMPRSLT